jgi:hypothetical protein
MSTCGLLLLFQWDDMSTWIMIMCPSRTTYLPESW